MTDDHIAIFDLIAFVLFQLVSHKLTYIFQGYFSENVISLLSMKHPGDQFK